MFDVFWNLLRTFLLTFVGIFNRKKLRDTMNFIKITIKSGVDKSIQLEVDPKWTVEQVKRILAPKVSCSASEIRIIFAGKELDNSLILEDYDIGQQTIVHVVKGSNAEGSSSNVPELKRPLIANILRQSVTTNDLRILSCTEEMKKVHFFVYCSTPCKNVCHGKLRVRCRKCKLGTLTLNQEPSCWEHVLTPERIEGRCYNEGCDGTFAEFFFKCANHFSDAEHWCVALYLIRPNLNEIPCLACMDISNPILVFTCKDGHAVCLGCFQAYCISRLNERHFIQDTRIGYTLPCPIGCEDSLIEETHHFRLLGDEQYDRYQRFAAEECVLQEGGVLCPRPGCGAGILPDKECRRIVCIQQGGQGCGFVFCRNCLQGYHIGECIDEDVSKINTGNTSGGAFYTEKLQWEDASKVTIKTSTKPCPKCRTPTERDGGCMHMVCSRSQCGFHWCWLCQEEWTRECMGNHWFG